jgi:hypothetical protein
VPVTGHHIVVRYQGLLQNYNIRHDFDSEMSSASGVPTSSGATASRPFEEPFHKEGCRAHCAAAPANYTKQAAQEFSQ